MGRIGNLRKGEGFLPETSFGNLKERMRVVKGKPRLRLLACIRRKQGQTLRAISLDIGVSESTLSNWLTDIQENGLAHLYDRKKPGRPQGLKKGQVKKRMPR